MKFLLLSLLSLLSTSVGAAIFNTSHFVEPGKIALGLEPEFTMTNGAGLAMNLKYTQGLNDLVNLQGMIGMGGGPRQFRAGGTLNFDFFPDMEGQPGIGLGTRLMWYQLPGYGQLEAQLIPYIHKTFYTAAKSEFEPFLAFPIGYGFSQGNYLPISTLALGSIFGINEHFRYVVEIGIPINNSECTLSGGIVWYP